MSIEQSKTALRLAFMHILIRGYTGIFFFFHCISWKVNFFPEKFFFEELTGIAPVTLAHPSDQLDTTSTSGLVYICLFYLNWQKNIAVLCYNVFFFILMAFRYFMAPIARKIHLKTGSHNDSKIYSAMLKLVESKKCTLSICQHYEAVPKIHIDAPILIFGIFM